MCEISVLRAFLAVCFICHVASVGVQSSAHSLRSPRYDKYIGDLPVIDARLQDFDKRHEEVHNAQARRSTQRREYYAVSCHTDEGEDRRRAKAPEAAKGSALGGDGGHGPCHMERLVHVIPLSVSYHYLHLSHSHSRSWGWVISAFCIKWFFGGSPLHILRD
jgi:hypothetical protein